MDDAQPGLNIFKNENTLSDAFIFEYDMSNIEHFLRYYIRRTFQQQSCSLI